MDFEFIKITHGPHGLKDRWECKVCRSNKKPECRFNLSAKKRGTMHKCRFCGILGLLSWKK